MSVQKEEHGWRIDRRDRFAILHRDGFACRYCGVRPGCDDLQVDHLVPRSRGGTDAHQNKVAACKTCNSRKSDSIFFPHDLIERQDEDGWFVHKTFGEWFIVFFHDRIGIDNDFGYGFIDVNRWPDRFWWSGLEDKNWPATRVHELLDAAHYLRQLVRLSPY